MEQFLRANYQKVHTSLKQKETSEQKELCEQVVPSSKIKCQLDNHLES